MQPRSGAIVAGWACGLALAAAALTASAVACGNSQPRPVAFYLEAEITIVDRSATIGTNLSPTSETRVLHLRWWSRDPAHARWEIDGSVVLLDGKDAWYYDADENTFTRDRLESPPAGVVAMPIPASFLIGPTNSNDLDGFVEQLEGRGGRTTIAGRDTLFGRPVTIVEASSLPGSQQHTSGPLGTPTVTAGPAALARLWVDVERRFILRYEARSEAADITVAVTRLDHGTEIEDRFVTFTPPAGARER